MSNFDSNGKVHMVDISEKGDTLRMAKARGEIFLKRKTIDAIKNGELKKGEVLSTAKIAGIMAAKSVSNVIPLCHPLNITYVDLSFKVNEEKSSICVESIVELTGKTGAEIEALFSVSVACLTIYDMCKFMDKEMMIGSIFLIEKAGGKSGHYKRDKKL